MSKKNTTTVNEFLNNVQTLFNQGNVNRGVMEIYDVAQKTFPGTKKNHYLSRELFVNATINYINFCNNVSDEEVKNATKVSAQNLLNFFVFVYVKNAFSYKNLSQEFIIDEMVDPYETFRRRDIINKITKHYPYISYNDEEEDTLYDSSFVRNNTEIVKTFITGDGSKKTVNENAEKIILMVLHSLYPKHDVDTDDETNEIVDKDIHNLLASKFEENPDCQQCELPFEEEEETKTYIKETVIYQNVKHDDDIDDNLNEESELPCDRESTPPWRNIKEYIQEDTSEQSPPWETNQ